MGIAISRHKVGQAALACVLVLVLALPSVALGAAPPLGSLSGHVTDGKGHPVEGARIELYDESMGKYIGSGWADAAGYYQFDSDPGDQPIAYRLKVRTDPALGLAVHNSSPITLGASTPSVKLDIELQAGKKLAADSFENDNNAAKPIVVGATAQERTLYPAGDIDLVSFSAVEGRTYRIETLPGEYDTDTVLALYESNDYEFPIKFSDDKDYPNRNYFSEIKITALKTGPLYVEVMASGDEDVGDYQLRVTEFVPPVTQVATVAGMDRYQTAMLASQMGFEKADAVVVATGEAFADALGGASLAGVVRGPLLLTRKSQFFWGLSSEIHRLGARKVYILGGEGAVSAAVEDQLRRVSGVTSVERIAGSDRYSTALAVAQKTIALQGRNYGGGVFVATGANFPDALGASPLAASTGYPILLAKPNASSITLPSQAEVAFICGGESAVSAKTEAYLERQLTDQYVRRFAGDDRFETAAYVAEMGALMFNMNWNGVGVTSGMNFPDALSAGPALASKNTVMLLTKSSELPLVSAFCLRYYCDDIERVHFFGGTAAVNQSVRNHARNLLH